MVKFERKMFKIVLQSLSDNKGPFPKRVLSWMDDGMRWESSEKRSVAGAIGTEFRKSDSCTFFFVKTTHREDKKKLDRCTSWKLHNIYISSGINPHKILFGNPVPTSNLGRFAFLESEGLFPSSPIFI